MVLAGYRAGNRSYEYAGIISLAAPSAMAKAGAAGFLLMEPLPQIPLEAPPRLPRSAIEQAKRLMEKSFLEIRV
ncbi:hypothetical protein LT40_04925 [Pseudomonas rhizosphaerae]|uniref:Uncharacterized protein n=1 Tax=Pseudomonas rhizosphaerae TaxID=216142 RepID=A0A089YQY1_9PSED|nr:hypothetical protein LT40_04925 [Pseudomonas rhizosphaerae]